MRHPYITALATLLLLVCTVLFLTPKTAWAATLEELDMKVQELQKAAKISDQVQDEIKDYRDYMKNENDRLFNYFNIIIATLSILMVLILFVIGYVFGQSRKEQLDEIRETKRENKEELNRIRDEYKEKLINLQSKHEEDLNQLQKKHEKEIQDIREKYKNKYERELGELSNKVKGGIQALQNLIQKENGYTSSRILIIGRDKDLLAMNENEIKTLRLRGINKIHTMSFDKEQLQKKLRDSQYDILIYRYLNDDETPYHIEISQMLKQEKCQIPYIIYNHGGDYVEQPDKNKIEDYPLSIFANFPSSLASYLFSFAYAFNPSRSSDLEEHQDD